jgi:hypothetical protein
MQMVVRPKNSIVVDVRCGNNPKKVEMCHNGNVICVDENAVSAFSTWRQFRNCQATQDNVVVTDVTVYPNPF